MFCSLILGPGPKGALGSRGGMWSSPKSEGSSYNGWLLLLLLSLLLLFSSFLRYSPTFSVFPHFLNFFRFPQISPNFFHIFPDIFSSFFVFFWRFLKTFPKFLEFFLTLSKILEFLWDYPKFSEILRRSSEFRPRWPHVAKIFQKSGKVCRT